MTPKKRHEVENFTALLTVYCKLYDINRIVECGVVSFVHVNRCS